MLSLGIFDPESFILIGPEEWCRKFGDYPAALKILLIDVFFQPFHDINKAAFFHCHDQIDGVEVVVDHNGQRPVHIVTRAKSNVVAYDDPPAKTGRPGRPCQYGQKLNLMTLFKTRTTAFEQSVIELYGRCKTVSFLCLDLIWKPVGEKVRFVLVADGTERFILMCSDLTLSAKDIIRAYSYRFKIEVNFKVLKHLMGAFFLPILDQCLATHWQTNGK